MRYPQLFATYAVESKISHGIKKVIIWHRQGSGKTAIAYFNVAYLTQYFQKQNAIPKFYFIMDRLDLMEQAKSEFSKRRLKVQTVNSKEEFKTADATTGSTKLEGKRALCAKASCKCIELGLITI
ncbi:MAG: DEAD/DEAH box helicase family protein [Clostridiales bacterium]|jgi:type I restriction enzyme R subunit|nr:DEAD/DEAH box helicase family protein [Clostridiales bacterium]